MNGILDSKWFYWAVTGVIGALWAGLLWFWKRQRTQDDERFKAMEKRQEEEHERVSRVISELPINYTLRDEFLRVTSAQNTKLDTIVDKLGEVSNRLAELRGRQE